MDLVPLVNGLATDAATATRTVSENFAAAQDVLSANWLSWLVLTAVIVALFAFFKRISGRLTTSIEDAIFSNWRLALLGTTGLVLSLASGWTTWDGMRNFTNEPVLSFMITFGIQGVMLIVAWLIGESFATGMNTTGNAAVKGGLAGAVIFAALLVFGLSLSGLINIERYIALDFQFGDTAILVAGLLLISAIVFASGAEMFEPYMASTRVIVRNAVLWFMFLSCMATSVFFSFDSLFSTIFPQQERERAAQLRAQNQVAGIIADIGQTISTQRLEEAQTLFRTGGGWDDYDKQLSALASQAQDSQKDIEDYFQQQREERNSAIAKQKNRKAAAEGQQAGLQSRKVQLTEELSRLQSRRPGIAAEVVDQQQVVREIERQLDEQRAVVLAEEKGVEGSGKVGRGAMWRAAKAEEEKIKAQLQVANERLRAPRERLAELDKRVATSKGELAGIDGELSLLQGEAQTAEQQIVASERSFSAEENADLIDPARILPAFERAKVEFRQEPTREHLDALQSQCSQLLGGMLATTATKDLVRDIDCDPKQTVEAASVLFALNEGVERFGAMCSSGDKLEAQKSTDALFEFARTCLADSGLPSQQTDALRTKINLAELNRDDRAHRFVVTWNAFQDGNRLAYLALAIAIAIDALVFMSGLFGANAVRSPLQDVPSLKPRSARQLEQIIENALLPNKYASAHATLEAMQPITAVDGYTQEVVTSRLQASRVPSVMKVLNAGAVIGAVQTDPMRPDRHLVRNELFEYLSIIAKREFEGNDQHVRLADLEETITVALQPHVGDHAYIMLNNLTPITKKEGDYSSIVIMPNVPEEDERIVKNVLNAGTLLEVVRQSNKSGQEDYYYVHGQLHRTLLRIAAAHPVLGKRLLNPHQALPGRKAPAAVARDLTPEQDRIEQEPQSLIADHTRREHRRPTPSLKESLEANSVHKRLIDHFANELSKHEDELEDIIRLGRALDMPSLRRALEAVKTHNKRLRDRINGAAKSIDNSLALAQQNFSGDDISSHALYDFTEELKRYIVLFLLSESGAYLNHLEDINGELVQQENEGSLSNQGILWREVLVRHINELRQAERRSAVGWSEIQASLQRFDTALASLADMG